MEYEVEGPRPRGRPKDLERLSERTVNHVNRTKRMLWIVVNGERCKWGKAVR